MLARHVSLPVAFVVGTSGCFGPTEGVDGATQPAECASTAPDDCAFVDADGDSYDDASYRAAVDLFEPRLRDLEALVYGLDGLLGGGDDVTDSITSLDESLNGAGGVVDRLDSLDETDAQVSQELYDPGGVLERLDQHDTIGEVRVNLPEDAAFVDERWASVASGFVQLPPGEWLLAGTVFYNSNAADITDVQVVWDDQPGDGTVVPPDGIDSSCASNIRINGWAGDNVHVPGRANFGRVAAPVLNLITTADCDIYLVPWVNKSSSVVADDRVRVDIFAIRSGI